VRVSIKTQGLKIPVSLVRFRVRAPSLKKPAYGWFFAFWRLDSPSNSVRWFVSSWDSPLRGQRKRCSKVLSHPCPSPGTTI